MAIYLHNLYANVEAWN